MSSIPNAKTNSSLESLLSLTFVHLSCGMECNLTRQAADAIKSPLQMADFHQFPILPLELQIMVWETAYYSLPPQVIEGPYPVVLHDRRLETWMDCWDSFLTDQDEAEESEETPVNVPMPPLMIFPFAITQARPPAILHACRMSRRIARRLGGYTKLWLDCYDPAPRPVWFNFATDIVFLTDLHMVAYPNTEEFVDLNNPRTHVQHLAIAWGTFHVRNPSRDHKQHWTGLVLNLYRRLPALTDLYCFIPAIRLAHHHQISYHFREPRVCIGLPIELKPLSEIRADQHLRIPPCSCPVKPPTLEATVEEIKTVFSLGWMKEALQEEFGEIIMAKFPPRVHGRVLLRKGLAMVDVPDIEGGRFQVDVDERFFDECEPRRDRAAPGNVEFISH